MFNEKMENQALDMPHPKQDNPNSLLNGHPKNAMPVMTIDDTNKSFNRSFILKMKAGDSFHVLINIR